MAAAGVLTFTVQPQYEAEAKIFVGQQQVRRADVAQAESLTELSFRLLQSYSAVIKTHPIARQAIEQKKLPFTPVELANRIDADPITDTQLIRLRFRSTKRELAQTTVNAVADTFVTQIRKIDVPAPGAPADAPAVQVTVVEPALRPSGAVSPNPVLNITLAVVLGLLLGVGVAFLAEYLDTRVKDSEDAEQSAASPVLATLPKIRVRKREVYIEGDNQSAIAETYRKLRTAIQLYGVDAPVQVVLVTSPLAGEGKTTIAANLAATYAYNGVDTLLLECDLRRPRLHQLFRPKGMVGLTTALLEHTPIGQSVMTTDIRHLYCLPAAAIPPNPVELLGSRQMAEVIADLRRQYRAIIIDVPPILPVADTTTLISSVDGVLLVAWAKETRRDRLADAALQVEKAGGRLMGVVLNASDQQSGADYYSYYAAHQR